MHLTVLTRRCDALGVSCGASSSADTRIPKSLIASLAAWDQKENVAAHIERASERDEYHRALLDRRANEYYQSFQT